MNCTGAWKEDTTVHTFSRISSSEQAPELYQNRTSASDCGIGSDSGEGAETASEVLASEIEMFVFYIYILILLLIEVNQFDIYMKISG